MKNTIYNAIQKGLVNALIFDNDSSISYQKSDIISEMEFPKVSLDELYDIFKDRPADIFNYDTKDCLSMILDDGQEISLHKCNKLNRHDAFAHTVFLKLSNDALKNANNDIIIACHDNHYISPNKLQWQTELQENRQFQCVLFGHDLIRWSEEFYADIKGYEKCQMIINSAKSNTVIDKVPAVEYCNILKSPLLNYKGYLPSAGQMDLILKYLDLINYIFTFFGFSFLYLNKDSWWTSTESSNNITWCLSNNYIQNRGKATEHYAFPLFINKK